MHTVLRSTATYPARCPPPAAGGAAPPLQVLRMACAACNASAPCLACSLVAAGISGLRGEGLSRHKVNAGDVLYAQGDTFAHVYALRSGTFKSTVTLPDGRDQICGFHMAGEVIALDGVASDTHATTTTALEDTQVSAIAYAPLVALLTQDAALQRRVSRLMSLEIVRGHRLMMLLGVSSAQERLAAFLLDMSQRFGAHGFSPHEFNLRMSRADIGSYLGLTLETVSRTFSWFQQQGWLQVDKRRICIVDLASFSDRYKAMLQA